MVHQVAGPSRYPLLIEDKETPMDTFLLQVSGDVGYEGIRDHRWYGNSGWFERPRDRDHGEVKPGDTLLVYCTASVPGNGQQLAFSVDVRNVNGDNTIFHLSELHRFPSPLHRRDIYRLVG